MKHLLALSSIFLALHADAGVNVIYGRDNRQDVYQVMNPLHRRLALSTAGMVSAASFQKSARPNVFDLKGVKTLERGQNICPTEAFAEQPTAATCSGFLVGPDTLITAGHCYKSFATPEQVCRSFVWVFDLDMKSPSHNPLRDIPVSNVYLCKEVVHAELSPTADFAVIKLDRPVVGREPLRFRTSGRVSSSTSLVVIGHPSGLPTKVSSAGRVTKNEDPTRFSTTLDTFHGNSGSAVFDANSGLVEGILIQGKTDYIPASQGDPSSCLVVNKCDENGGNCLSGTESGPIQWGEVVLRLDQVLPHIQRSLNKAMK
jgi:V8-like Glu-specific endopeptidase